MQGLCLSAGQTHPYQPGRAQGVSIEGIAEHKSKNGSFFNTSLLKSGKKVGG